MNKIMAVRGEPGHVLIVDDDDLHRINLRILLEAQHHEITEAADGEQALQTVFMSLPDVIILDVVMETYYAGFEVCRQLKNDPKTAHIPILLVTVRDESE